MIIGELYFGSASSSWAPISDVVIPAIGVIVALGSAAIAFLAYVRAKSRSAEARINAMFREMLAMEFQLHCTSFSSEIAVDKAVEQFDRYKLWVLEELWLWVDRRKDQLPWSCERYRRAIATNDDWADVICVHLNRCGDETKERLWGDEAGYNAGFQTFIKDVYDLKPIEGEAESVSCPEKRKKAPGCWDRVLARYRACQLKWRNKETHPGFWQRALDRCRVSLKTAKTNRPLTISANSPSASAHSLVGDLKKLAQLKTSGTISNAEFTIAKARLLGISV